MDLFLVKAIPGSSDDTRLRVLQQNHAAILAFIAWPRVVKLMDTSNDKTYELLLTSAAFAGLLSTLRENAFSELSQFVEWQLNVRNGLRRLHGERSEFLAKFDSIRFGTPSYAVLPSPAVLKQRENFEIAEGLIRAAVADYQLGKRQEQISKPEANATCGEQAMKPRLFIGSSVEGLPIAREIQQALEYDCEPTVWNQGVFALTHSSLRSLMDALQTHPYAVFVVTPDDMVTMRDKQHQATRDNVLFELGLFIGKHGIENVFMVHSRGSDEFQLPTDLLGITTATYDAARSDKNLTAALGPACNEIRKHISAKQKKRQPKYQTDLIVDFRQLKKQYSDLLRQKLKESALPPDFPLPDDLSESNLDELTSLCGLVPAIDEFKYVGYPGTLLLAARLKISERGEPATAIEVAELRKILDDLRKRLQSL